MKVLSPGTAFRNFKHNCAICAALLEVEEGDIKCNYYADDQRERGCGCSRDPDVKAKEEADKARARDVIAIWTILAGSL